MIKILLSLPVSILVGTINLAVMLGLTVIGFPIAAFVLVCGLGLAFAALILVLIPIFFLCWI